jgi:hypothetical protein
MGYAGLEAEENETNRLMVERFVKPPSAVEAGIIAQGFCFRVFLQFGIAFALTLRRATLS